MEVGKKKKKVVVLCSRFPQKVQRRQRNVQKSVMRVQSSCFAYLNLVFCVLVAVAVFVAEAP